MGDFLRVVVLAVIQGFTEFLPVSSSGHLVLAKHFLGLNTPGVILEVTLHAGTLLSILFFYRKRIVELTAGFLTGREDCRRYGWAVILGSVPAALAYLALGKRVEAMFSEPLTVSLLLCVTGALLLSLARKRDGAHEVSVGRGLLVGLAQAVALVPGISRSGSTITIARHLGMEPAKAAEFSLLLSLPALVGATVKTAVEELHHAELGTLTVSSLGMGALLAAVVGYFSILLLVRTLSANRFWLFGFYCMAAGGASAVAIWLGY